jgi:hypothetical protein
MIGQCSLHPRQNQPKIASIHILRAGFPFKGLKVLGFLVPYLQCNTGRCWRGRHGRRRICSWLWVPTTTRVDPRVVLSSTLTDPHPQRARHGLTMNGCSGSQTVCLTQRGFSGALRRRWRHGWRGLLGQFLAPFLGHGKNSPPSRANGRGGRGRTLWALRFSGYTKEWGKTGSWQTAADGDEVSLTVVVMADSERNWGWMGRKGR